MGYISVEKAIRRGQLWVTVPVMIVMLGSMFLGVFLLPNWTILPCILASLIFAWLTWSILITKWRIWAFSNVEDLIELHEQAVTGQLIWQKGSFFEKTEICNAREKAIIEEFEIQINKQSLSSNQFKDDVTVPIETAIFFVKSVNVIQFLFSGLLPLIGGCYFFYQSNFEEWFFILFIIVGLYQSINEGKEIFDKNPQIILNKESIKIAENEPFKWKDGVQWNLEQHGSKSKFWLLEIYSNGKSVNKEIDDLDINPSELKRLIKIYSGRASLKNNNK